MCRRTKTDNSNLTTKLELRRYFLRKYHRQDRPNVLDCCQGSGTIWNHLRQEFALEGFWGVDTKTKKGRLKIDSSKILAQPGWAQNVIDIDTYGSPWRHWFAMLPNVARPLTVFLTVGHVPIGGGTLDRYARQALGLQFRRLTVPNVLLGRLVDLSVMYCLSKCVDHDILLVEVVTTLACGNARYFGARIAPLGAASQLPGSDG
jgi:hypothetical protein